MVNNRPADRVKMRLRTLFKFITHTNAHKSMVGMFTSSTVVHKTTHLHKLLALL